MVQLFNAETGEISQAQLEFLVAQKSIPKTKTTT